MRTAAWREASANRRLRLFSARFSDEQSSVMSPFGRSDGYKTLGGERSASGRGCARRARFRRRRGRVGPAVRLVRGAVRVHHRHRRDDRGRVAVHAGRPGLSRDPASRHDRWTLPAGFDEAEWYGRGPQENYIDRRTGAAVGLYRSAVADLSFPYERPQETGTRTDTRWVALSSRGTGVGLLVVGLPTFEFSAYPNAARGLRRRSEEDAAAQHRRAASRLRDAEHRLGPDGARGRHQLGRASAPSVPDTACHARDTRSS